MNCIYLYQELKPHQNMQHKHSKLLTPHFCTASTSLISSKIWVCDRNELGVCGLMLSVHACLCWCVYVCEVLRASPNIHHYLAGKTGIGLVTRWLHNLRRGFTLGCKRTWTVLCAVTWHPEDRLHRSDKINADSNVPNNSNNLCRFVT